MYRVRAAGRPSGDLRRLRRQQYPPCLAASPLDERGVCRRPGRRLSRLGQDPAFCSPDLSVTRPLIGAGLALAMLVFGFGAYHAAGFLKADHSVVKRPSQIPAPPLPVTDYLSPRGALY